MEGIGAAPALKALPFALGDVRLLNGPFQDAQNWNIAFMKRIDPNRLLHAFRLNAGLPSNATAPGRLGGTRWRAARTFLRPLSFGVCAGLRHDGRRRAEDDVAMSWSPASRCASTPSATADI